jgi:hypothetical protein
MQEAEGLNFKCGIIGDENKSKKIKGKSFFGIFNNPSLQDVLNFIQNLNISDEDKIKLNKMAKKTPHGSLSNFAKNYMIYLKK